MGHLLLFAGRRKGCSLVRLLWLRLLMLRLRLLMLLQWWLLGHLLLRLLYLVLTAAILVLPPLHIHLSCIIHCTCIQMLLLQTIGLLLLLFLPLPLNWPCLLLLHNLLLYIRLDKLWLDTPRLLLLLGISQNSLWLDAARLLHRAASQQTHVLLLCVLVVPAAVLLKPIVPVG